MGTDPYEGLADDQVLAQASHALRLWGSLPVGSVQRAIQRGLFDSAMAELDRRLIRHVRARLGTTDGSSR